MLKIQAAAAGVKADLLSLSGLLGVGFPLLCEATLAAVVVAAVSGTPSILLGAAGVEATGAALVFQGLVDIAYGALVGVKANAIAGD